MAAIRTYSYYNAAWCLRPQLQCSPLEAQSRLPHFAGVRRFSKYNLPPVKQHLLRGKLTLSFIKRISADREPELAMGSALWLPVQTYYAAYNFAMAYLAGKHGVENLPATHGRFMKVAEQEIVALLLPPPWNAILRAGYKSFTHMHPELVNIPDHRPDIGSGFNIASPDSSTLYAHIAQCLDTTRRRLIQADIEKARRKNKKRG